MKRKFKTPRPDQTKYNDPKGRFCGCGKPAFKRKCGSFVCADCDAMENNQAGGHRHSSKRYTESRAPGAAIANDQ